MPTISKIMINGQVFDIEAGDKLPSLPADNGDYQLVINVLDGHGMMEWRPLVDYPNAEDGEY